MVHYNSKPNGDGDAGVNLMVTVMMGSYHYNSKPNGDGDDEVISL